MITEKYCERCNRYLGNIDSMDYYRFIKLKYCGSCAKIVDREKASERMRKFRAENRKKNAEVRTQLGLYQERTRLLQEENELLRERVAKLREEVQ